MTAVCSRMPLAVQGVPMPPIVSPVCVLVRRFRLRHCSAVCGDIPANSQSNNPDGWWDSHSVLFHRATRWRLIESSAVRERNFTPLYYIDFSEGKLSDSPEKNLKNFSIAIFRIAVLCPGFPVVALLAQCLPVALVPEQVLIPSVRDDMIHNCRFPISAILHASDTERMGIEILSAGFLPSSAVSSAAG